MAAAAGVGAGAAGEQVIVVRYRPWLGDASRCVREALLVGTPGSSALTWPAVLPPRFVGRAKPLPGPSEGPPVRVFQVDSVPYAAPPLRAAHEVRANGVWAVDADFVPAGGLEELGVPARATIFGMPIAPSACGAWAAARPLLPAPHVHPVAVYHGTDAALIPSIQAHGLKPSPGMLGDGVVSVGTFWKATRYAARTTDKYVVREAGVIVRAYLDPGRCAVFDGTGAPCPCPRCAGIRADTAAYAAREGLPPTYDAERTRVADHVGAWQAAHDTAYVGVVKSSGGAVKKGDGAPKYANKNAEYAVLRPAERLELQCMALLDLGSMAMPHWDATQRTQRIL